MDGLNQGNHKYNLQYLLSRSSNTATAVVLSRSWTFVISPPPFLDFMKWICRGCSVVPGGMLDTITHFSTWSSPRFAFFNISGSSFLVWRSMFEKFTTTAKFAALDSSVLLELIRNCFRFLRKAEAVTCDEFRFRGIPCNFQQRWWFKKEKPRIILWLHMDNQLNLPAGFAANTCFGIRLVTINFYQFWESDWTKTEQHAGVLFLNKIWESRQKDKEDIDNNWPIGAITLHIWTCYSKN